MKNILSIASLLLVAMFLAAGCRGEEPIVPSEQVPVVFPDPAPGDIKGFFLLNEANMGSNKASLDYFDYETGVYHRNIFPERNPMVVHELGDVGNDLQIYDDRLWAVINCSNFVRVMDVQTAREVGTFSVPNCRYIVFDGDFAYVSSYAGPVLIDRNSRIGKVVKVDIHTLETVAECTVGYQPEQMAVAGDKLYVANSGGYRAPDYDTTVSVIDLASFTETRKIDTGVGNLHRMELDQYGRLWILSRGDSHGNGSKTIVIDSATDRVTDIFDLPGSNMTRLGDTLYVYNTRLHGSDNTTSYATIDTRTKQISTRNFITDGTERAIAIPYGLAVNPSSGEIFITDARNYVSPGTLHCYSPDGMWKWSVTTGDIPAHIAFTTKKLLPPGEEPDPEPDTSAYITRVLEFAPAPGQFVNQLPAANENDTDETMCQKVLDAIGNNKRGLISLGGWGGYVVVGFDHTIVNVAGERDFRVLGNTFGESGTTGGSEPGVIMVAHDANKNGVPDPEEWFEIAGSAHLDPTGEPWYSEAVAAGNDVNLYLDYEITYFRPDANDDIRWEDNRGGVGYISKNSFHSQSYFPLWVGGDKLVFRGTRLPQNGIKRENYLLHKFRYGYADNDPNNTDGSTIDIDWAVDANGEKVDLPGVDFIKIHTGVNQSNGWIGECSTELMGIENLHPLTP